MSNARLMITAGLVLAVAACDGPTATAPLDFQETVTLYAPGGGGPDRASGGGKLDFGGGLMVDFAFGSVQHGEGLDAQGQLRFSVTLGGELIEFHGRVTCLAVDADEGRAWIGGVVTQNNSTRASHTTPIHEVGKDIWFRVLDSGEGQSHVDRATFVGFEGGGGIITSQEYCEAQIWPDDNARTQPVAAGNVQVKG